MVLVDDVVTSGSTLLAAVQTLADVGIDVAGALAVATATPWLATR